MNLQAAVFQRINGHAPLTALLGEYGGEPAVFSDRQPSDFVQGWRPSIIIDAPVRQDDRDTFSREWRDGALRIRLYAKLDRTQPTAPRLREASEMVRALFHRRGFTVAGLKIQSVASGPTDGPVDDASEIGRVVQIQLMASAA